MGLQAEKLKRMGFLAVSLLCSVCKTHGDEVSHIESFQAVELGEPVTITCWISNPGRQRVWYKLTPDRRLQTVASTDTLYNVTTFKAPLRYAVRYEHLTSHLTITSTTWEDAGTYFCGVMNLYDIEFGKGTFLLIKGANVNSHSVVQQPQSESVLLGGSVTLSCSVHANHCTKEQTRIMWLKSANHSDVELIHSFEDVNISCHRTDMSSASCVHNVLLRNLGAGDAGTYYCAVNSCGRVQFGSGTRVIVLLINEELAFNNLPNLSPTVVALVLSNVLLGVMTLLLLWSCFKNKTAPAAAQPSDGSSGGCETEVVYAAVCAASRSSSCQPAPVKQDDDSATYSDIKH
ncbi:uncharacterized protein LOC114848710 [Betta splendens]|uniref:Uncharacterized protein LOC114848710 n=1 Tax=Betta splendens TaxID=158456 RepID=A0A6P7LKN1_BETSP|nr:uncharacterized protein LOC114848710 [Betta splendens]